MQISLLTSLSDADTVLAIGADGTIAGYSPTDAVTWSAGTPSALWTNGRAYGLNDLGEVVGYQANSVSISGYVQQVDQAAVLLNGTLSLLQTGGPAADSSFAYAVNHSGVIAGQAVDSSGVAQAVIWQNGQITYLGTLTGGYSTSGGSSATGINDSGYVIGNSVVTGGATHAFLRQYGSLTDLGVLATGDDSHAYAINAGGLVVGSDTANKLTSTAVIWENGGIVPLPFLSGYTSAVAEGINDAGLVVGFADTPSGTGAIKADHAVLWQNNQATDLNNLLPANSGWVLSTATGINDSDQIFGTGIFNGVQTNFVLTLASSGGAEIGAAAQTVIASTSGTGETVVDSAANVALALDGLQAAATSGKLGSIQLTDSGFPALMISAQQLSADSAALNDISGNYTLTVSAGSSAVSIAGSATHATTVQFSGDESQYTVTAADGTLTVSKDGVTDTLSNAAALHFDDQTTIIAQTPGSGTVTTGNIAELYSAVLAREPDVAGLAYYQNYLKANPATPLLQFAEWFLSSPEYLSNSAHIYAQNATGDAKFISDSYENLLHREPETGAIPYYQSVINSYTQGLTPGTTAYAAAETLGHAWVLTYFSASPEFISDVQVTASHPADAQHWLILV